MNYEKVVLELLNRIVNLEERVEKLEKASSLCIEEERIPGSKKYRLLSIFLEESNQDQIKLSYEEIEDILDFKLPDSALTSRTFWANTTSHSIALSWLSVNYFVADVNIDKQYVIFEKKRDFEMARTGVSTVTSEENYLASCRSYEMLELYKKLRETMFECFDDVYTGATSYYTHWYVSGTRDRQFANIYIQKKKIRIETLIPTKPCEIGEKLPDTHGYTLNYKTEISSEEDIEKVKGIILDSYEQIKLLV